MTKILHLYLHSFFNVFALLLVNAFYLKKDLILEVRSIVDYKLFTST